MATVRTMARQVLAFEASAQLNLEIAFAHGRWTLTAYHAILVSRYWNGDLRSKRPEVAHGALRFSIAINSPLSSFGSNVSRRAASARDWNKFEVIRSTIGWINRVNAAAMDAGGIATLKELRSPQLVRGIFVPVDARSVNEISSSLLVWPRRKPNHSGRFGDRTRMSVEQTPSSGAPQFN
jgi:hypothetical protein